MLREVPAGQREPNCDSAKQLQCSVCGLFDCTWPCATLVAVTMCGTAEATKDHLNDENEHSLCYSSQLGSQAPSRDRSTRAESGLCRVSVACVSYGSTMLRTWNQGQGSDWSVRGGIDTGPLVL